MKKALALTLVMILALSLAACGGTSGTGTAPGGNNSTPTTKSPSDSAVIEEAEKENAAIENAPDAEVLEGGRYEADGKAGLLEWIRFGPGGTIETSTSGTGKYTIKGSKLEINYDNGAFTSYVIKAETLNAVLPGGATEEKNYIILDDTYRFLWVGPKGAEAGSQPDVTGTVSLESKDGYTYDVSYALYYPVVSIDTANAKPGRAYVNVEDINGIMSMTVKNTTVGHNVEILPSITVFYPDSELAYIGDGSIRTTAEYYQDGYAFGMKRQASGDRPVVLAYGEEKTFIFEPKGNKLNRDVPEAVAQEYVEYFASPTHYRFGIINEFYFIVVGE